MAWKRNRSRGVQKLVTFTDREWTWVNDSRLVENRQRAKAGLPTLKWSAFARERLMTNRRMEIIVPDIREPNRQLARIGTNINQIAHRINIRQQPEYGEIVEVKQLLEQAISILRSIESHSPTTLTEPGQSPWLS